MRKVFILAAALLMGLQSMAQYRSGYSELEDSETASAMRRHIGYISSPTREGRLAGTEGERETAAYVYDILKDYGVEMLCGPEGDVFGISRNPGDTLTSRNIVGIVQGTDRKKFDRYIVVAARMDNLGVNDMTVDGQPVRQIYRGANGNASGLAMMLELARMVSTNSISFRRSVIFLGLGASNQTFAGAWYFLNRSFSGAGNIDAAINLDMVGSGDDFYVYTASNEDLNAAIGKLSSSLQPIQPKITASEPYPSDHRAFYSAEIPSAFFTRGLYPEHNTPRDTEDIIDYQDMERELEYVYNFTLSLSNAETAPAFNTDKIKKDEISERVYTWYDCDEKPTFLGHSDIKYFMNKWVYQYLKYPKAAQEQGIQGRVQVEFSIDKDGTVCDVEVVKGVDNLLDDEAVKVISASPKWKAGKVKGVRVKSRLGVTVDFVLEKKNKNSFGIKK